MSPAVDWTLSIVSHGHISAIARQLESLSRLPTARRAELIVTLNLPEPVDGLYAHWPGDLRIIRNARPRSYAANHNAAARCARSALFACLDPDLAWREDDPFPALAAALQDASCGLVAPSVLDEHGQLADHARLPPTPVSVLLRRWGRVRDALPPAGQPQLAPWLAGLFLAARTDQWRALQGFDERFRMYAEDVELGLRAWTAGLQVLRLPVVACTHRARRESKSSLRRLLWHSMGLGRLWLSATWRQYHRLGIAQSARLPSGSTHH